jgi:hypothetical protein
MDELVARVIPGTETEKDSGPLFYSPDGQYIGYFSVSAKKLKKISPI